MQYTQEHIKKLDKILEKLRMPENSKIKDELLSLKPFDFAGKEKVRIKLGNLL